MNKMFCTSDSSMTNLRPLCLSFHEIHSTSVCLPWLLRSSPSLRRPSVFYFLPPWSFGLSCLGPPWCHTSQPTRMTLMWSNFPNNHRKASPPATQKKINKYSLYTINKSTFLLIKYYLPSVFYSSKFNLSIVDFSLKAAVSQFLSIFC